MLKQVFIFFIIILLLGLLLRLLKFCFKKKIESKIYADAYKQAQLDIIEELEKNKEDN